MKKILSAIMLSAVMALSVCACGGGAKPAETMSETTTTAEVKAETIEEAKTDTSNITLISEDELLGEWKELQSFNTLYLEKDKAKYSSSTSSNVAVGPWKLNGNTFSLNTSLIKDDFKINIDNDVVSIENDNYCFMRFDEIPMEILSLSDTGQDDVISLTLDEIKFETALPDDIMKRLKGWGVEYGEKALLDEGQVYACLVYELSNNSKNNIQIGDYYNRFRIYLDYNNGFIFSTDDSNYSYYTDGTNLCGYDGRGLGDDLILQPLQTKTITTYLRCSDKLLDDKDSSLKVIFVSLLGESGAEYYKYIVQK